MFILFLCTGLFHERSQKKICWGPAWAPFFPGCPRMDRPHSGKTQQGILWLPVKQASSCIRGDTANAQCRGCYFYGKRGGSQCACKQFLLAEAKEFYKPPHPSPPGRGTFPCDLTF